MSRSKHAVELCALLVDETYGELTSRIFTALLRRGRLHIAQISAHTHLMKRQIQHGLVVLIQQNLLYHHLDESDGRTYYEANHDAAYALVRTGKIVELVDDRYGIIAKDIVQNLLLLGHGTVSDLEAAYEATHNVHTNSDSMRRNDTYHLHSVNGKSHSLLVGQLHSALTRLLQSGFVEPVIERMFRSPTDTQNVVEKEELRRNYGGQTKGTRQKEELKIKVRQQLKSWRDEGRGWQLASSKRLGERMNGINGQGKKRRFSRGEAAVNGNHVYQDDGFRLDQSLVVRVNYEKCTVALRNRQLVELANSRIGETTSQVYAELLRLLEENIPRCRIDPAIDDIDDLPDSPAVTTTELSIALSKTIKLSNGIGDPSHAVALMGKSDKSDKSAKGRRPPAGDVVVEGYARPGGDDFERDVEMNGNVNIAEVDEDVEMNGNGDDPFDEDLRPAKRAKVTFQEKLPKPTHRPDISDDRDVRLLHLKGHLQLLAQDSCKFIRKGGKGGSNEWTVDFESLVEHLRESEVDTILMENFGQGGLRLVRMLRKLGKFEEKALPNLALMKQKDIRTKMAEMQMAGMVDIQEVPRDAGRSNNRTIFLWYFDPVRVSSILLDNVYKAMSRCLQRLEVEKRRSSGILAMMERTDVRESTEEEVLDDAQLRMLEEIRAKEEMLLGQIARLDDLVGVFRDF